jgi:hypothetical protein
VGPARTHFQNAILRNALRRSCFDERMSSDRRLAYSELIGSIEPQSHVLYNSAQMPKKKPPSLLPFNSEELLREAIAGLLRRMNGITAVDTLHGMSERGKDIVFRILGGFGETLQCACVVKNTPITGSAYKPGGAREVFFQAQQALDTPYQDSSGNECGVERVYFITPYPITAPTIESISGALKEHAGQIKFVFGAELFELFKPWWPDFMADEANALDYHLRDTISRVESVEALNRIAEEYQLGRSEDLERRIYVRRSFHRTVHSLSVGPYFERYIIGSTIKSWSRRHERRLRQLRDQLPELQKPLQLLFDWDLVDNTALGEAVGSFCSRYILAVKGVLPLCGRTARPSTEDYQSALARCYSAIGNCAALSTACVLTLSVLPSFFDKHRPAGTHHWRIPILPGRRKWCLRLRQRRLAVCR